VNLPQVVLYCHVSIPLWHLPQLTCDLHLVRYGKGRLPALLYTQYFIEMVTMYPNYTVIYTDRLWDNGSTVCTSICDEHMSTFQLNSHSIVCTDELYAIYQALLYIRYQSWRCFLICSDSFNVIQSLLSHMPDHLLTVHIICQLSHLCERNYCAVLHWVLGQVASLAVGQLQTEHYCVTELYQLTSLHTFIELYTPGNTSGATSCEMSN
jgi:hypothetical protein